MPAHQSASGCSPRQEKIPREDDFTRTCSSVTMRHAQAPANNVVEPEPPCELVRQLTVKLEVLVPVPLAVVTAILPVTAPAGTVTVICVAEFTVKLLAARPPKVTLVAPVKLVPVIVTVVPTVPL